MGEPYDAPNNFVDNLKANEAVRRARERAITPPRPEPATKTNGAEKWLEATFHGVIEDLRSTPKGNRNNRLRWAARRLAEISHAGLDETRCRRELERAAQDNGLWQDDGANQCRASIESGWGKGKSEPADLSDVGTMTATATTTTEAASGNDFDRVLTLEPLAGVRTTVPTWVWEHNGHGRIQLGTLSMFAGRPAAGKSTAARWFAAQLTRGTLPGVWHGHPVNVAVMQTEEQHDAIVVPGLQAAGADLTRLCRPRIRAGATELGLRAIADETDLTNLLLDRQVRVLIVDPIMATFDGKVDIYRNNEVRQYLAPFTRIAKAINGIVIGVVHLRKGQVHDVIDGINGSSAFGEVPRAVFGFAPADDGSHIMEQVKNSAGPTGLRLAYKLPVTDVDTDDGRTQLPVFEIIGEAALSIADLADESDLPVRTSEATEWLKWYLYEHQPAPSAQVKRDAKAADIKERTLHRARKSLGVLIINQSQPDRPRTTVWMLPAHARA